MFLSISFARDSIPRAETRGARSDFAIHPMAEIFGEADSFLSMTALRAAAEGGRTQISLRNLRKLICVAIIDQSDPLAMLAAKR
jgi:hypothetical protein